jgi:hypothetical protein
MIKPTDLTEMVENITNLMVGKTIKAVDESSQNCISIEFTDGTNLLLEAENIGMGLIGIVGYIPKPTIGSVPDLDDAYEKRMRRFFA